MTQEKWSITSENNGSGGFLCPPGHPNHRYSVIEGPARNPRTIMAVDSAATEEWVPAGVRERAARLLTDARLVESPLWVGMVYGYFHSMYLPESGSANVADLITDRKNELPAERHAAVAYIRRYFPQHSPRLDLIKDPGKGYGSYACVHCDVRVQYEARGDGLAVMNRGGSTLQAHHFACSASPDGKHHH